MDKPCINVMVVGDADCGKSYLLNVFSKNKALDEETPITFNNEVVDIEIDGYAVALSLFNTAGGTLKTGQVVWW